MQSSLPYGLAPHAELHSEEHWRWLMHIPRKEPTSTKLAPTIPISASLRYLSARVQGAETIGICRVDGNKVNSGNAQRFRYCSTHHSLVLPCESYVSEERQILASHYHGDIVNSSLFIDVFTRPHMRASGKLGPHAVFIPPPLHSRRIGTDVVLSTRNPTNTCDPHNVLRGSQRAWFCACLGTSARTISTYSLAHELSSDPTSRSHLAALYDALLQKNLLRTVEPYSVIEIDYVARPSAYYIFSVKNDLGQGVHGVLDQERGCPIVFDELEADADEYAKYPENAVFNDKEKVGIENTNPTLSPLRRPRTAEDEASKPAVSSPSVSATATMTPTPDECSFSNMSNLVSSQKWFFGAIGVVAILIHTLLLVAPTINAVNFFYAATACASMTRREWMLAELLENGFRSCKRPINGRRDGTTDATCEMVGIGLFEDEKLMAMRPQKFSAAETCNSHWEADQGGRRNQVNGDR
ncbi:hypothetical protein F4604DRAFT_1686118 [Suillus subluteus]|nr:hypothetical protein F4604DRAFT_1686118 [Suillus subluteus]